MEKRVLVTIAISIGILLLWFRFFPTPAPEGPPAQGVTQGAGTNTPAARGLAQPAGSSPQVAPNTAPGTATPRPPEQRIAVERPGLYHVVLSTWGAAPSEFTLLDPQYLHEEWVPKREYLAKLPPGMPAVRQSDEDPNFEKKLLPINMVSPQVVFPPFAATFPDSGFALDPKAAWTLARRSDEEIVFSVDAGMAHVEKKWTFPRTGYAIGLEVRVDNRGPADLVEHLQVTVTDWQDPVVHASGFSFGARSYNLVDVSCDLAGKLHHKTLEDSVSKPFSEVGDVKWVGAGKQYFLMALALPPEPGSARRCSLHGEASGHVAAEAYFAERRIPPGQATSYPMVAFIGPKLLYALDAVSIGGSDAKLGDAVNYTLEFVARPMLWVLQKIQRVVVNWGLALIVFTLLLKLATWWPTQRSMQSMRGMSELKPKMDAIRDRFKDDKQRQNQEVMALYKTHGINPLGGCLPMLIQMPIYIAFYSMLANAVELYRASFIGPINDMTAPFWPLAAVTGVLMFVQARLSPQSPDSQQQKMMMYMMPVMFTAFTIFLPSGLTLYILTNTLLTMAQQWAFNRMHPLPAPAVVAKAGKK